MYLYMSLTHKHIMYKHIVYYTDLYSVNIYIYIYLYVYTCYILSIPERENLRESIHNKDGHQATNR